MIYLASPYSDPDPAVRKARYEAALRVTGEMIQAGDKVFAPVVYSHQLAESGLRGDWEFWRDFDLAFLERCESFYVLALPGWRESRGVRAEAGYARMIGRPLLLLDATGRDMRLLTMEEFA